MRLAPREISLDILDRCLLFDALVEYRAKQLKRAERLTRTDYIRGAEDNVAQAEDLMKSEFFSDVYHRFDPSVARD